MTRILTPFFVIFAAAAPAFSQTVAQPWQAQQTAPPATPATQQTDQPAAQQTGQASSQKVAQATPQRTAQSTVQGVPQGTVQGVPQGTVQGVPQGTIQQVAQAAIQPAPQAAAPAQAPVATAAPAVMPIVPQSSQPVVPLLPGTPQASAPVNAPPQSSNKKNKKQKQPPPSALDQYIREASVPQAINGQVPENGSIWSPAARFSDLASDLRARHVDDIVTIVVQESASAVSTGQSKTSRNSAANASVTSLAGIKSPTGGLANLLNLGQSQSLDGEGTTSRQTTLTTTVSARVTHVLVNGNLVVEGTKHLDVNSENQIITIRGVIRPIDLDTTNSILSARLAQMEIQVNGKGIVNDAVRRPFFLYRLLLGLLPF